MDQNLLFFAAIPVMFLTHLIATNLRSKEATPETPRINVTVNVETVQCYGFEYTKDLDVERLRKVIEELPADKRRLVSDPIPHNSFKTPLGFGKEVVTVAGSVRSTAYANASCKDNSIQGFLDLFADDEFQKSRLVLIEIMSKVTGLWQSEPEFFYVVSACSIF